jgi:hypothetical protein
VALTASFVRHRERRDRIYVSRGDGTSLFWDFPSYGDVLPHDLCHLVIEDGLGISNGFWGLVDQGVEVRLIDNAATLVHAGRPLVDQPGVDLSDLRRAEEAVARLGPLAGAGAGVGGPDDAQTTAVRRRLDDLGQQWRRLGDGDALTLSFGTLNLEQPGVDGATTTSADRRGSPRRSTR